MENCVELSVPAGLSSSDLIIFSTAFMIELIKDVVGFPGETEIFGEYNTAHDYFVS